MPAYDVLIHDMDRSDTVAASLLRLAQLKQVDTLVLGLSGYRSATQSRAGLAA